ncbi:hypothetical protein JZ751_003631 [Albula glossodonta]|uniref:Uncharacterized protein n=1 Tax=Albula glossodonta TaxID=121402 RepID=A0A8T2N5W5_9TELE|nr:hypothetical protein JZ751_003631 [Albula glossodonta]
MSGLSLFPDICPVWFVSGDPDVRRGINGAVTNATRRCPMCLLHTCYRSFAESFPPQACRCFYVFIVERLPQKWDDFPGLLIGWGPQELEEREVWVIFNGQRTIRAAFGRSVFRRSSSPREAPSPACGGFL